MKGNGIDFEISVYGFFILLYCIFRHPVINDEKKMDDKAYTADADGMEDISSDSSSATSKYSHLNSSSGEEEEKKAEGEGNVLKNCKLFVYNIPLLLNFPAGKVLGGISESALEGVIKPEGEGENSTHPWAGYSDYYNPRFMRGRGSRRPRGVYVPRRGWGRGFPQPNPNVPMNSFYMQSINSQYYK